MNDQRVDLDIKEFLTELAPKANPDSLYFPRMQMCLRTLLETGGGGIGGRTFLPDMAKRLGLKTTQIHSGVSQYLQFAWFIGNKALMSEVLGCNIDTAASPTPPEAAEFLKGCLSYLTDTPPAQLDDVILPPPNYRDAFKETDYYVLEQKDRFGKTFKEIGGTLGLSVSAVRHRYVRAKLRQKNIYLWKIAETAGRSQAEMEALDRSLTREFHKGHTNKRIVEYLEAEFGDILSAYRSGA